MLLAWLVVLQHLVQAELFASHSQSLNGVLLFLRGSSSAKRRGAALAAAVHGDVAPFDAPPRPDQQQSTFAGLMARLSGGASAAKKHEDDDLAAITSADSSASSPARRRREESGGWVHQKKRKLRVLALDGGGMKGRNLLVVIRELEARCGKPVSELFDLVCGTSIGGCGALFVAHFGASASDKANEALSALQTRCFASSSPGRFVREGLFCADAREELVTQCLGGSDVALTNGNMLAFVVAAKENQNGEPEPFLFRTYEHHHSAALSPLEGTSEASVVKAIAATTAAPTYFPPFRHHKELLTDGGCAFNNPSLLALHEIAAAFPDCEVDCLVSVGCGATPKRRRQNTEEAITHRFARAVLRAANPDALYDRLNPPLPHKINPGEHREPVLENMEHHTRRWLAEPAVSARLDAIARRLLASSETSWTTTATRRGPRLPPLLSALRPA